MIDKLINDQNFSVSVKSYNRDFHAIMKGSLDGKYLNSSWQFHQD